MTPTLRKRLLIGAAGVVGLLIVALLAAPSLIDLNARKAEVIAAVKKATGRDLVIDGPVSPQAAAGTHGHRHGRQILQCRGGEEPEHGGGEVGHRAIFPARPARRQYRRQRGDAGRAQDRPRGQRRGQAELGIRPLGRRGQARGATTRRAPAGVARPARHRERHADLQRFPGRSLRRRREGQFQRLGRLDRRALFVGRQRHRSTARRSSSISRSAPRRRRAIPRRLRWRRAAASSPSRAR